MHHFHRDNNVLPRVIFKSDEICEADIAFKPSVTVSPPVPPIK